ncbi:MAG: MFS transporter [Deltaproteobacteria bacterium]|nr:MFS transporter [Deltaproteobacteria bacterium]
MEVANKATSIDLFNFKTRQMRAFHMSWFAFFLCFFAWFGIAPLMAIVRDELGLTKQQIGNTIIASVSITIIARLFIGWLCDRIGPRLTYTWLLVFGSLPVMGIGLAYNYETFLVFRLAIGAIGGAFVITQYHTSVMFAPNCVGTANATSAGWGNLGGGVTQMVMPLIFAFFVSMGFVNFWSWRLSMLVAGVVCFLTGIAYYFFTTDLPDGNFQELRDQGKLRKKEQVSGTFAMACKDPRVWALFVVYGACFGVELTINNIAALYFKDYFGLGLKTAGLVAGLFGLMNIFARTTGGVIGDKFGHHNGLKGRVRWLFIALLVEGIALIVFSRMTVLPVAIGSMILFSLFTQMSEGATYSVVPFINKKALGSVAGIVGAGGNMGAVAAGFLFRSEALSWPQALLILGVIVSVCSFATFFVTFSVKDEEESRLDHEKALAEREKLSRPRKTEMHLPSFEDLSKKIRPMDLLRMYLGLALTLKGIYFILNMNSVEQMIGDIGHFENVISWYVVFVHVIGGGCLFLGLATRIVSFLNSLVLVGAVIFVHSAEGLFSQSQGLELTLFVLFCLVLFIWQGAGKASFDSWLKNNNESKI